MKFTHLRFVFIFLCFLAIYTFASQLLVQLGYLNFEPLFISSNISSVFVVKSNVVKNFFLTYPLLSQIAAYPFTIFGLLKAPYYVSLFCISLFNTWLVHVNFRRKSLFFTGILFLFLALSPVNLYLATSGTSAYLHLILYYLCFFYLFKYVKRYTTYHLAIFSLYLSLFTFLNYKILYLAVLLVPMTFLFSANSIGAVRANILLTLDRIAKNISLRRKFLGRFGSMIIVVSFFPITMLLIYLTINYLFGHELFFFESNGTSQWNSHHIRNIVELNYFKGVNGEYSKMLEYIAINNYTFIALIIALMPLFFVEYFTQGRNNIKQIIFLAPVILLVILFRDSKVEMLNLNYFLLFSGVALASITSSFGKKQSYVKWVVYPAVFIIAIFGEWYYFKNTISPSEKIFYNNLVLEEKSEIIELMKVGAEAIKREIPANDKILCDHSVFYPLIALNHNQNKFVNNLSDDFQLSISNPKKHASYIIVTNPKSPFYDKDIVRQSIKIIEDNYPEDIVEEQIIYENAHFRILRIKD